MEGGPARRRALVRRVWRPVQREAVAQTLRRLCASGRCRMKSFDLSSRKMERVLWLWPGYIPLEEVTIIQGDPGLGKGHIAADLVARFTTGRAMPGETGVSAPGRVLWPGYIPLEEVTIIQGDPGLGK